MIDVLDRAAVRAPWWATLACRMIAVLPGARVLHLDADAPSLVEELVARGVDAFGVQASSATGGSRLDPARIVAHATAWPASFPSTFSTVVWTAPSAHPPLAALRDLVPQLMSVSARHLVLLFDPRTLPHAAETIWRDVDDVMRRAGFRRHPAHFQLQAYDTPRPEWTPVALAFERRASPPTMDDRLEESGRIRDVGDFLVSDEHGAEDAAARYALVARLIDRLDVVIDVGRSGGAGAAVLYDGGQCARLVAIDDRPEATRYAREAYGACRERLEFEAGGLDALASLPDHSADLVVSLDPTVRTQNVAQTIAEFVRVLLPGGRVVVGARGPSASDGVSRRALLDQLSGFVAIDQLFAQCVERRPSDHQPIRRGFVSAPLTGPDDLSGVEWWIAVGVKDPLTREAPAPATIDHPRTHHPTLRFPDFEQGYATPWLAWGLVMVGRRASSARLLIDLACRTLEQHPEHSPDRGAALCVLGYRLLEGDTSPSLRTLPLEAWLEQFVETPARTPLESRWRVSNAYLLAQLRLSRGDHRAAELAFGRCADATPVDCIPTLATKMVHAAFWAGWLAHQRGALADAHQRWTQGMGLARHAIAERWEMLEPGTTPIPSGLWEAGETLKAADRCAQALAWSRLEDGRAHDVTPRILAGPADARLATLVSASGRFDAQPVGPAHAGSPVHHGVALAAMLLGRTPERPTYAWGAGMLGRRFALLAGPHVERLAGFIDSAAAKQGTRIAGRPVHGPELLQAAAGDAVRPFVIVTSQFADELMPSLERWGYTLPADIFVFPTWA